MEHVVILSKISNQTIGVIIGSFFGIIFLVELIKQGLHNLNAPKIIPPTETLRLEHLSEGVTIIVLDTEGTFPIIQTAQSYQTGMKTNVFENTFLFDGEGKYTLEKGKTYEISSLGNGGIKVLNQVNILITSDSVVG